MKNGLAPINRVPPEVLTLIPDSWDELERDEDVITLTHVCRAWREIFISHSSLWANFQCTDTDKTRIYLERSKSSPIGLSLSREGDLPPHDPYFQVIPRAIGRLKSLFVQATPNNLSDITAHLSHPAPLLEYLSIDGDHEFHLNGHASFTTTLFNGDLSSLHTLHLQSVHTELPWRNMVHLTVFTLFYTPPGNPSIGQLLDFFESAPHLRQILLQVNSTSSIHDSRLVSLASLKSMDIIGGNPSSLLLDHLLIPVGATLTTKITFRGPLIEDHLPRSLDNLKNLSNFTKIDLRVGGGRLHMRFTGPNGEVSINPLDPPEDTTCQVLESLAQFNTSGTERLDIDHGDPPSIDHIYEVLRFMNNLRILALSRFKGLHMFMYALRPNRNPSKVMACPKLEELIFVPRTDSIYFDVYSVLETAAARALRGAKLRTVKIFDEEDNIDRECVSELRKHVVQVEFGPRAVFGDGSDDSGESGEDSGGDEGSDESDED